MNLNNRVFVVLALTTIGGAAVRFVQPRRAAAPRDYEHIGEAYEPRCTYSASTSRCKGDPIDFDFEKDADSASLAQWANAIAFSDSSDAGVRVPASTSGPGVPAQIFSIRSVADARSMRLDAPRQRPVVIARIVANPEGETDTKYHIGRGYTDSKGFANTFFIAVSPYKVKLDGNKESREIGRWRLYGIRTVKNKAGKQIRFVSKPLQNGSFRWCNHPHPDSLQYYGAQFQTCPVAKSMLAVETQLRTKGILGNASLLSLLVGTRFTANTRAKVTAEDVNILLERVFPDKAKNITDEQKLTIKTALNEFDSAPAWVSCGVGCCTAEF